MEMSRTSSTSADDPWGAPGGPGAMLLRDALDYAAPGLCRAHEVDLWRETPCRGWRLADLLSHVDDVLETAAEAAAGFVLADPPPRRRGPSDDYATACRRLGQLWHRPAAEVWIGPAKVAGDVVAAALALEVAVHGWDVRVTLGDPACSMPRDLARRLLEVARRDLPRSPGPSAQFAAPLIPPLDATESERLLALLGRPSERWCQSPVGGRPASR